MKVEERGWQIMKVDAGWWKGMQADENGWKWMQVDESEGYFTKKYGNLWKYMIVKEREPKLFQVESSRFIWIKLNEIE